MDKNLFYEQLCEKEEDLSKKIEEVTKVYEVVVADLKEQLKAINVLKPQALLESKNVVRVQEQLFPNHPTIENNTKQVKRVYKKRSKTTVEDRVLKAIKFLRKGTAKDVATQLVKFNPKYDFQKASADAKYHLSRLKSRGMVIGHPIEGSLALEYECV